MSMAMRAGGELKPYRNEAVGGTARSSRRHLRMAQPHGTSAWQHCARTLVCASLSSLGPQPFFSFPGGSQCENNLDNQASADGRLQEYAVQLDRPNDTGSIGLTLAPDPCTGKIVVQTVKEGSPAALSELIQVGDILKQCSAVLGDDMLKATDIRRVRWAINNRSGKVKLVLERGKCSHIPATWYSRGQVGRASQERDTLQLPVNYSQPGGECWSDWTQDTPSPGRPLTVAFHRGGLGNQMAHRSGSAEAARGLRLQSLRDALVAARAEPELDLGRQPHLGARLTSQSDSSPGSWPSDMAASNLSPTSNSPASKNVTPITNSPISSSISPVTSTSSPSSSNLPNPVGRVLNRRLGSVSGPGSAPKASTVVRRSVRGGANEKKVIPLLPWLLLSSERLDTRDLTDLASQRGLSALLELGLSNISGCLAVRGAGVPSRPGLAELTGAYTRSTPGSGGASAAASEGPSPETRYRYLIATVVALQRLVIRRLHGTLHHAPPEETAVLLHCSEPGMATDVACLIATWAHIFGNMPLQEALLSAEEALGCTIEQGVVQEASQVLLEDAEERTNRVVLAWRYGGLEASVAGDVVGSWSKRVPLARCKKPLGCKGAVARGSFYLELTGLRPGIYGYKFIVDGSWAVDPAAPKVVDNYGNWNNVLQVFPQPPTRTSRERLALVRWHARMLAWESKMGLHHKGS